ERGANKMKQVLHNLRCVSLVGFLATACQSQTRGSGGGAGHRGGGAAGGFDGQRAFSYIQDQMGFGPRIPGTRGHDQAGDPLLAVLFDMVGDSGLRIPVEQNSLAGAPEVVERVWRAAEELGYGNVFVRTPGPILTDDHVALQRAGIHAIDVVDFDYGPGNGYWHTPDDTIDKVSARSLQTVGDVALAVIRSF